MGGVKAMRFVRGDMLAHSVQQDALRRFVHRFTRDHRPRWADDRTSDGQAYRVQFAGDADWLANSLFAVTVNGHLDKRKTHCTSYPTWPDHPELRKPGLPPVPVEIST
jgi:hypothetical protein